MRAILKSARVSHQPNPFHDRKNMRKILKSARGQIAIFVVLAFQVLFILFAMTINVGLVVHDKINLQNSLDLAAYYGAKKQAEVLNAMAHINYQMRQNWKLLAWRYRILGTLLQDHGRYKQSNGSEKYWCPQNEINDSNQSKTIECNRPLDSGVQSFCNDIRNHYNEPRIDIYGQGYCDYAYFICISNRLWQRGINSSGQEESDQNLCEKFKVDINPITGLWVAPGDVTGVGQFAANIISRLQDTATSSCKMESALNWIMAQMFLTHFRLDQRDRKVMMEQIYQKTLDAGKDLDEKPINKGAATVFCKNLTSANRTAIGAEHSCNNFIGNSSSHLDFFNSFEGKTFTDIFEYLNVRPVLHYLYTENNGGSSPPTNCDFEIKPHYDYGAQDWKSSIKTVLTVGNHSLKDFIDRVEQLFSYNYRPHYVTNEEQNKPLKGLTLGFRKKDKMLYYGLKANIQYKPNIFSLRTSINFKASALAKPFGGQFGPAESDPHIPLLKDGVTSSSYIKNPSPSRNELKKYHQFILQPNYSRWPGDKWGLIDYNLHSNNSDNPYKNFLNKHSAYKKQQVYTYQAFVHRIFNGGPSDPLARPPVSSSSFNVDAFTFMRMMELMAVYPDLYDISNYSILGNYHETYFKKICMLLTRSPCNPSPRGGNEIKDVSLPAPAYIRGDFGWPETKKYMKENKSKMNQGGLSIAPEFLRDWDKTDTSPMVKRPDRRGPYELPPITGKISQKPHALTQGSLFYPWLAKSLPAHLLSSWYPTTNENRYADYNPDDETSRSLALNCIGKAVVDSPVPTACAAGGRSGYSVKLISCEVINTEDLPGGKNEWCSPTQ